MVFTNTGHRAICRISSTVPNFLSLYQLSLKVELDMDAKCDRRQLGGGVFLRDLVLNWQYYLYINS